MSKANRKFQEPDIFGKHKIRIAPTKRIKQLEEKIKKEKRAIRRAINKLKYEVE